MCQFVSFSACMSLRLFLIPCALWIQNLLLFVCLYVCAIA
jgi:hypothetical protein